MRHPPFIPGLQLSGLFYREAVRPILDAHFPGLPHSAALTGNGSEVLGFDTPVSRDHDWGPRVRLFLCEADFQSNAAAVETCLNQRLPDQFHGYPVPRILYGPSGYHCVEIDTIRGFFLKHIAFDIEKELEPADWLTIPEQKLRTIISGEIFQDDLNLRQVCQRFTWYPDDIWFFLLAAGWNRLGEEEHLMGRAGQAGDELGSAIIAARLVRDLMRLCFLMDRQYAPYPKWFGTGFAHLPIAAELAPLLRQTLHAKTWKKRQQALAPAYEMVAARHNELGITPPMDPAVSYFFDRPFLIINADRFAQAIAGRITDPVVMEIIRRLPVGSVDQFSDSTELLNHARDLRPLFIPPPACP
ncbi:MAG TPA: DUF4037 domain-containing protein [Anaerolineaceae bacterium]|nr:DUF4037 domain-containing protein [Anaerolineaceae bacterium]HPN50958.1 DUF4037 domain-containing protein [Anaerolineaceae bacterium]